MTVQELKVLRDLSKDGGDVWTKGKKQASPYFKANQSVLRSLYNMGLVMRTDDCCGIRFYMITDKGEHVLEALKNA